jgi:hypothetical protein
MASPASPSRPPGRGDRRAPEHEALDESHEERFGPLALERMHKDDGRLLIVFRDASEER